MPLPIDNVAIVTINGGTLTLVMKKAFTNPNRPPSINPMRMPNHIGNPKFKIDKIPKVLADAAIEPTERSSPFETITNVIPKAIIAVTADGLKTFSIRLLELRKVGEMMLNRIKINAITNRIPKLPRFFRNRLNDS
jgi:hypothetical protein